MPTFPCVMSKFTDGMIERFPEVLLIVEFAAAMSSFFAGSWCRYLRYHPLLLSMFDHMYAMLDDLDLVHVQK